MTLPDPTEEIKTIRHRLGADFDYDLNRIFADIQRRQSESGFTYVTRQPRLVGDFQTVQAGGGRNSISPSPGEMPPAAR
jgi:hypothetical protein